MRLIFSDFYQNLLARTTIRDKLKMMNPNEPISYWRVTSTGQESESGFVIVETPVSLTVNGEVWLSFMCTPVHLEAMAVGFLFNEGLIESKSEIADVRVCAAGDNVDVWLNHKLEKPENWRRTSGCTGGVTSIESEASPIPHPIPSPNGRGQVAKQPWGEGPEQDLDPYQLTSKLPPQSMAPRCTLSK